MKYFLGEFLKEDENKFYKEFFEDELVRKI